MKVVRLLFLIGGHVHLCLLWFFFYLRSCFFSFIFFCCLLHFFFPLPFSLFLSSLLFHSLCLYLCFCLCDSIYRIIPPEILPEYMYISDNVRLFGVRAFTSKIQKRFFYKRLEKLVGLFIVYISIFVLNDGQRDKMKIVLPKREKHTPSNHQMTDVNVFGQLVVICRNIPEICAEPSPPSTWNQSIILWIRFFNVIVRIIYLVFV